MGLNSLECIEKFRDVLNFLGYKTAQSVAKLRQQKDLDGFVIAASKLDGNMRFLDKFGDLKLEFEQGDILVLKDIAAAAAACVMHNSGQNPDEIQKRIFDRLKKVSQIMTHVLQCY